MERKRLFKLGLILCSLSLISGIMIPTQGIKVESSTTPIWEKAYESPNEDVPVQVLAMADGYILTGSQNRFTGDQTPWVIKVDLEGNELWNKSYTPTLNTQGHIRSIDEAPDGGFILTGFAFEDTTFSWDLWILKINENGTEEWNQTFNGVLDGPDYGAQILSAPDGGYLVSGATQAVPGLDWNTDYWLIKIDASGNEKWNKTYHRVGSDQGTGLVALSDGNYLLSGLSKQTSSLNSPFSIWVIKIDENGTIIWDEAYEQGSSWYGAWENNIIETIDGGFLLVCYPFGGVYYIGTSYWIIKCDLYGNIEWDTTFNGDYYDTPTVCLQSLTGDYYIGGSYNSPIGNVEKGDMCIVRLNNTGDIQGYITYGNLSRGERIVDMVLVEGSNSSEAIVALAYVENGGTSSEYLDFWLGNFDKVNEIYNPPNLEETTSTTSEGGITTTTEAGTPFAGLFILYLAMSVGVLYQRRRRR
ncbi:MAG: hypothetical protein ACFFAU_17820 [Candidatus Hodarchaeota archaeon]